MNKRGRGSGTTARFVLATAVTVIAKAPLATVRVVAHVKATIDCGEAAVILHTPATISIF